MSVVNMSRWSTSSLTKLSENQKDQPWFSKPHPDSQTSGSSPIHDLSFGNDPRLERSLSSINSYCASTDSASLGTLIIVVMKAKNLHNRRAISKQNPYCTIRVAKHNDRTKTITRGGQAPVWDHEIRFNLDVEGDNRVLKICVFDQNGNNTEIIGDATIPLKPALEAPISQGYDGWFPIHCNKKYVGEVYLELTFYPKNRHRSSRSSAGDSVTSFKSKSFADRSERSIFGESLQRSPSPHLLSDSKYSARPLPQLPMSNPPMPSTLTPALPIPDKAQEDISRRINDGYEASIFEKLMP